MTKNLTKEKQRQNPQLAWIKKPNRKNQGRFINKNHSLLFATTILIIAVYSHWLILQRKSNYAKYELIPEIQKLVEENFTPPFQAFELATEVEKYIPNDSLLVKLWPRISESISLHTQPEGAIVSYKDYKQPADSWKEAE